MSNINDSFIRISEIMRNSILRFDISAEVKESITRMNDHFKILSPYTARSEPP